MVPIVKVPPAATSYGLLEETGAESAAAAKLALMRREAERTRWLNSPNSYQKVEFLESGTSEPKKITKWVVKSKSESDARRLWVQDATSPQHSTTVKISDQHQFSPLSINAKEFKNKQKEIKEARRVGDVSAGPKSQILDGASYEDYAKMKDAELSGNAERIVMIGTASKGIIERDFQHNAQVYRQMYAPNPFSSETDDDIQRYMNEVKAKSTTLPADGLHHDPTATVREEEHYSPTATDSPTGETVSLMQAARDHRPVKHVDEETPPQSAEPRKDNAKKSPRKGEYTKETTFDARTNQATTRLTDKARPSSIGGFFHRSKSDRFNRQKHDFGGGDRAASDDEAQHDGKSPHKKDKKKKFGLFSFGKKKHKEATVPEE